MILELIQDPPMLRLLPLVLGAFAIGAETFLVSGVLPQIAADLRPVQHMAIGTCSAFARRGTREPSNRLGWVTAERTGGRPRSLF